MIKETHARTVVKAAIYRVLSVIAIMSLTLLFGGSLASAGKVGLAVIVFGTAVYYIHERLWVRAGWGRNIEGFDYVKRSVVKTIIYRGLTMVIAFLIAKAFITGSNTNAAAFSIAQALTNMCLFFIVERVFNKIAWGKINDQT